MSGLELLAPVNVFLHPSVQLMVEREKELIDLSNNQHVILSGVSESTLY